MFKFPNKKIRILLWPGLGDQHWCLLKLQGMLATPDQKPDVYIWNFDGRPRTLEFLERIPFITAAGYHVPDNQKRIVGSQEFRGLNHTGEHVVIENWLGFDYVISFNGALSSGQSFDSILPGVPINWSYPINQTAGELAAQAIQKKTIGSKYVVLFFSEHGMFKEWSKRLPRFRIQQIIDSISRHLPDHVLVLSGASWDRPYNSILRGLNVINAVGQTNLDQFFAMLRGASGFLGFPGGNTIIATHLNTPCVMLWDEFFNCREFRTNWVDPAKINKFYFPLETRGTTNATITDTIVRAIQGSRRD